MALIFPRIARNFIKNGYFPTDLDTLARVASALDVAGTSARVLDPCCGEGAALAHLSQHLQSFGAAVDSFGVDVDEERAWHAKTVLGTAAHADINDVRIAERSMGLLFLNPPYGDLLGDHAGTGDAAPGRQRHEKLFVRRCLNLLQPGGVLVLVVPFYVLDLELSSLLARNCQRLDVFMAPEQQFKQCVLFGVKRKPSPPDAAVVKRLVAFGEGLAQRALPETWTDAPYLVPELKPGDAFHFNVTRLDARQLAAELDAGLGRSSLWPQFGAHLRRRAVAPKRPLRAMTDWHLALALAAGQITGVVESNTGRRLLIKGRTHKTKDCRVVREESADGTVSETRVLTDRFVTVIRGIDLSPGEDLGRIVTIA